MAYPRPQTSDRQKAQQITTDTSLSFRSHHEEWDYVRPQRRFSDTAFDYASSQEARLRLRPPSVKPSIYGEIFQNVTAGPSRMFNLQPKSQIIDAKT
jgi:hypothetical protein